jgi:methylamine methyltransferase corrinoid protein reductive activase
MVTDYGTNAEMALKVDDEIFTGSAAAGPAIEGEHISMGMLAAPGAISDVEMIDDPKGIRTFVLDEYLMKRKSDLVNPFDGELIENAGLMVKGLTGTGVIALVATGIDNGLMRPGKIPNENKLIRLQNGIEFTQEDLVEVGKTIAAFMAGHTTLVMEAGISLSDVGSMYMTGASGTYVDAYKSMKIGLVPGSTKKVWQVGNTSLALARDIVENPGLLDEIQDVANSIRAKHIMFANEKVFENSFAVELGVWTQGMPEPDAAKMRDFFKLDPRPGLNPSPEIIRLVERDIDDLGREGLTVVENIGLLLTGEVMDCDHCLRCVKACNEDAISMEKMGDRCFVTIRSDKCMGTACRRCERRCRSKLLHLDSLKMAEA